MKKSSIAFSLLALLGAGKVFALGLGEPQVRSYLGQSLRVTAPLMVDDARQERLDNGSVSVGDKTLFRQLQLPYQAVHAQLQVELKHHGGVPFVELTTRRAFTEPMLEVPLDIQFGRNRLVRVMTLLLDPPPAGSAMERLAVSGAPQDDRTASASPGSVTAVALPGASSVGVGVRMPSPPRLDNGRYGPVALHQTLGDIAREVGYREATLYQNLVALWEANPGAFLHDNMNHLKAGVTLRIPSRERVLAYSSLPAREEVLAQYRESRNPSATPRRLASAEANDEVAASPAPHVGESNGAEPVPHLKISAAIAKADIPAEFREEFNTVYVALEETEQENTELRSRIELLEKQVATMSEMLLADAAIKVEQLEQTAERSALNEQAAAQGEDLPWDEPVSGDRNLAAPNLQERAVGETGPGVAESLPDTADPVVEAEPLAEIPIRGEQSAEPRRVLASVGAVVPGSSQVKSSWWSAGFAAGLLLLVLLGAGGWLLQRRRQMQHYQQLFRDF